MALSFLYTVFRRSYFVYIYLIIGATRAVTAQPPAAAPTSDKPPAAGEVSATSPPATNGEGGAAPPPEGGAEGQPPAEEVRYKKVAKIVVRKVLRTYLHMVYAGAPEELVSVLSEHRDGACVYLVRHTPGMVPLPSNAAEAARDLPKYLELGVVRGRPLAMLEQLISHIYLPLLTHAHRPGTSTSSTPSRSSTTLGHSDPNALAAPGAAADTKSPSRGM